MNCMEQKVFFCDVRVGSIMKFVCIVVYMNFQFHRTFLKHPVARYSDTILRQPLQQVPGWSASETGSRPSVSVEVVARTAGAILRSLKKKIIILVIKLIAIRTQVLKFIKVLQSITKTIKLLLLQYNESREIV